MKPYSYNCIDKSIVLPYFKQYYVSFFFKFVPQGLTANYITLISTSFIFALIPIIQSTHIFTGDMLTVIIVFCLHNYIVGDHLDGMQAKNTGTSSPLGEFLDHYLDVYNGAIVFYFLTVYLAPIPNLIFYLFLFLNSVAFAITMFEELERNELYFGPVGTLEGVILLIFFLLSWLIPPVKEFWQSDLVAGYPTYWLAIVLFGIGYAGTIMDVLIRLRYVTVRFGVFLIISFVLSALLYLNNVSYFMGWLLVTLFSGEYISKIMDSYLVGTHKRFPDLFVSMAIPGLAFGLLMGHIPSSMLNSILTGMAVYLFLRVCYLFVKTVFSLRGHWHWVNPK